MSSGTAAATLGQKLEGLLDAAASLSRPAVLEVMVFCLDNAATARSHADQVVSRLLDRPPGPLQSRDLAILYCISDVLYNASHAHRTPGAAVYRQTFQDALPGIMHRLHQATAEMPPGSNGSGSLLQLAVKAGVRRLFQVWQEWEVFPQLFVKGLEAVMFGGSFGSKGSGIPVAGSSVASAAHNFVRPEVPSAVKSKLEAYAVLDLATLERQCKNRGLAVGGSKEESVPRATLLGRLRLFEEYWALRSPKNGHGSQSGDVPTCGTSTPSTAPTVHQLASPEDVDGEPVDMSMLLRHKARAQATAEVAIAPSAHASGASIDDLDGEPIGVLELQRWRAAAAVGAAGGGILASSPNTAIPRAAAPSEALPFTTASVTEDQDLDGEAIDVLLYTSQKTAATALEQLPPGWEAQKAGQVTAQDQQSLRKRARHKHDAQVSREHRPRRRAGSPRRQLHSKLLKETQEHRPRREGSRSRRRRRVEASSAATAAAAAAAAAANAAAFISARSRAPAAPVLAPLQAVVTAVDSEASNASGGNTSHWNSSQLPTARQPTPEPDDELDGDPLDSGDEQHLMLQERLAEKKRRFRSRLR